MGALTVAGMITLTSHTEDDPYSAFWVNVPDGQIDAVEKHFVESPSWRLVHHLRASNLAYIESTGTIPRVYAAKDDEAVDAAASFVETLLGREADSVS